MSRAFPLEKTRVRVVSWNVLHIVHELNHSAGSSFVLDEYRGNESYRILDIFDKIRDLLGDLRYPGGTIVLLQEVPGDLRDCLRAMLEEEHFHIAEYCHDRCPELHDKSGEPPYGNMSEYLMAIVPCNLIDVEVFRTFGIRYGRGKAGLVVDLTWICLVCNHFSRDRDERREGLGKILDYLDEARMIDTALLMGDMNCDKSILIEDMKEAGYSGFKYVNTGAKFTRHFKVEGGNLGGTHLDHIVISSELEYENTGIIRIDPSLSDHDIIEIEVIAHL